MRNTLVNKNTTLLAGIRMAAMNFLAIREHSVKELYQKLSKRFPENTNLIGDVLIKLEQENLQSDERFTEAYIGMRIRQGKGPLRIFQELEARGVMAATVNQQLAKNNTDWWSLAQRAKQKRFGEGMPVAGKEKAQQVRFLLYRGFSAEMVSALVS